MNLRDYKAAKERREALEKECKVNLANIGTFTLDESQASTKNCENMIGIAQVPLGVAGPLKIISSNEQRATSLEYYVPLATTEGALVASINRGCKAINPNGGATVGSYHVGATRGPVFKVKNLAENQKLHAFF